MGNKIEKCEDVLNGLKVNWAGYEPPGGETWRKVFVEEIGPLLRKSRADAVKELEVITQGKRTVARLNEIVETLRAKSDELEGLVTTLAGVDPMAASTMMTLQSCVEVMGRFAKHRMESDSSAKDISEIEEDIKFFDAFEAMVEADAELDKMLYAMLTVEDKYRVKLLRASCRMLTVVEENREVVRRTKSVVASKLKGVVAQIVATLDGAYAVTSVYLRQLKKDYAHHGIAALASLVAPELPRQTIPENLKISTGVA
jgi:hypothetical protein